MEVQQALYHFESASPLLFRQIYLFNILISERTLRHRDLRNKVKLMRKFDTGEIVVVNKQMKSTGKDGLSQKLVFKTKGPYRVLDKATPGSYFLRYLTFLGSSEARKKREGISGNDGKDTTHYGTPK